MTTNALVRKLKENGQDLEWYPTTPEIIAIIKRHLEKTDVSDTCGVKKLEVWKSILDCGAGDGRTLKALTNGKKYAIEKSEILVAEMDPDVFVVGCDFWQNSLIDKKVDTVFSNPPYSQYREWSLKIINEANAKQIFLVIPERWKDSPHIMAAIEDRKATFKIIGNTDFLDAERKARASVDIVKISLQSSKGYYSRNDDPDVDPFTLWVKKTFPLKERTVPGAKDGDFKSRINELVPGRGLVPVLVELYEKEMVRLQNNFRMISELDPEIFKELNVSFDSIRSFLMGRIVGLKEKYWRELFDNLDSITDRLTVSSRKALLNTLTDNISVDFNESNIYAVTIWAIKNANRYFDSQLIDVFTGLSKRANMIKYKSNQKTWEKDEWRFNQEVRGGHVTRYSLDYRCIFECYNTFSGSSYSSWEYPNGLHNNVHDRLNDILTIANNLGFSTNGHENSRHRIWNPGKTQDFCFSKGNGKYDDLMSVKAYKNGNIHIKFNQKFLKKLNVEFGRLKGWLRDHKEAAEELNISEHEAKQFFKGNFALQFSDVQLLQAPEPQKQEEVKAQSEENTTPTPQLLF